MIHGAIAGKPKPFGRTSSHLLTSFERNRFHQASASKPASLIIGSRSASGV